MRFFILILFVFFLFGPWIQVQAQLAVDKSQYSLFNPTPKEHMRELSTDRPDKTESPYTVDAGRFQIELDIVTQSKNKTTNNLGEKVETINSSWVFTNFKAGLTHNIDLQVIASPLVQNQEHNLVNQTKSNQSGVSDTTVRLKVNLFGNDAGDIAMAVIPFVVLPTQSSSLGATKVEAGLSLPMSFSLPNEWSMGLMTHWHWLSTTGSDYNHQWINTITVGHDLSEKWGGYLEIYSESSDIKGEDWVATFDTGLTYAWSSDVQFDFGVNIGLTEAADDLNPFLGWTYRF